MKLKKRSIVIFIMLNLTFFNCKTNEVKGIIINSTLYTDQTYTSNRELVGLIKQILKKDEKALISINDFQCVGAAGCYDLGFVVTQLIYKMGEEEFIKMIDKLSVQQKQGIKGLIEIGLEYGDNDKDNKMDETTIFKAFPQLNKTLN